MRRRKQRSTDGGREHYSTLRKKPHLARPGAGAGYAGDLTPEIFTSDQGLQFTSTACTTRLADAGIRTGMRISWDGRGRARDTILVERLWRSVNYEEVYLHDYDTVTDAVSGLSRSFRFYHDERLHQALDYQTPAQVFAAHVA